MLCPAIVETEVRNDPGRGCPSMAAQWRGHGGIRIALAVRLRGGAALLLHTPLGERDLAVQEIGERDPLGLECLGI